MSLCSQLWRPPCHSVRSFGAQKVKRKDASRVSKSRTAPRTVRGTTHGEGLGKQQQRSCTCAHAQRSHLPVQFHACSSVCRPCTCAGAQRFHLPSQFHAHSSVCRMFRPLDYLAVSLADVHLPMPLSLCLHPPPPHAPTHPRTHALSLSCPLLCPPRRRSNLSCSPAACVAATPVRLALNSAFFNAANFTTKEKRVHRLFLVNGLTGVRVTLHVAVM